jgi:hypothetical protein
MATFYTGNTGRSTGPHLDFRVYSHRTGGYVDPTAFTSYVTSGDGGLDQFTMTSPYGADRGSYIHKGIDYATEIGTPITVAGGKYLTTWDDKGGGGITSQYEIDHDGEKYDILLMHGSDQNKILSQSAVTDGVSLSSFTPPETPQKPTDSQVEAKTRAKAYADMSKAEMNAAYDKLRASDPAKARVEGMKMHKAFFGK